MVRCVYNQNGSCAVSKVAEITVVPYYELIHSTLEKAEEQFQLFFSRLLSELFRISQQDSCSYEILFQIIPVSKQTYAAQVKMFFIILRLSDDASAAETEVERVSEMFKLDISG